MKEKIAKLRTRLRAYQIYGRHLRAIRVEEAEPCTCLCCGTEYRGNFCPGCGQSSRTRRFTLANALENVTTIFTHADGRVLHTITDLFTRPGYMIWDYLKGRRKEYIQPIQLLFFLGTLYLVLSVLLHVDILGDAIDVAVVADEEEPNVAVMTKGIVDVLQRIMSNKAIASLTIILFIVWPMKVSFGKVGRAPQLNMTELFYAMSYMECLSLICSILLMPLAKLLGQNVTQILFPIDFLLQTWACHQLFLISWKNSMWRMACTFALLTAIVFLAVFVGVVIFVAYRCATVGHV